MEISRPAQNKELASTKLDDSVVIIDRDSKIYWLNPVASRIWELSDGENTVESIAAGLCEEFEVSYETSLVDTRAMVRAFLARGLFERANEGSE